MARFELKNTTIRLRDGYSNTGAVNDTPATGDTTLTIDTLGTDEVIPVSSRFTVVGSTLTHEVTATDANAQLDIDVDAGTGNFTVTIAGNASGNIAHDADAATALTAVNGITGVSSGDFTVTKDGTVFTVKAVTDGEFGNTAVVMSGDVGSLSGGSPTATQTHAGGVTHDITFTPAIATATGVPSDDAVITFTGRSLSIRVGDGAVDFTENREFLYDLDRGNLDTVREGDQIPLDVSIDFVWDFLTAVSGASTPTISDVLHRRGLAATWESSSSDACEPFALDIEIEYDPPCAGTPGEIITLPDFRWESLPHSGNDANVSMTGRCNATNAIIARMAS